MDTRRSGNTRRHRGRNPDPRSKVLRIGIIRGPRIVEERLIRSCDPVTVGEDVRNSFVLPPSFLPTHHRLFAHRGGRYHLIVRGAMRGKLFVDDQVQSLARVADSHGTRRGSDTWIPLAPSHRGKIQVENTTILFQFVQAPPEPRRIEASFSPLALGQMDWVFTGFVVFSLLLNLVGYGYINSRPPPHKVSIDQIGDRFAQVWFTQDPPPTEDPVLLDGEGPETEIEDGDTPKDADDALADDSTDAPSDDPADGGPEMTREQLESQRREEIGAVIAALFGTNGDTSSDMAVRDLMGDTDGFYEDLDASLDASRAVKYASLHGEPGFRDTHTGPMDVEGPSRGLGRSSRGEIDGPGKGQTQVIPTVEFERPDLEPGTDARGITDVVGKNKGQIKACYERIIKTHPDVAGRVVALILVAEDGTVSEVWIDENTTDSQELGACIQRRIRRWDFPATGNEYEVSYPFNMFSS